MNKNEISSLNGNKEEIPELDNDEKLQRKKEEKNTQVPIVYVYMYIINEE
jgi:hypothetical protein